MLMIANKHHLQIVKGKVYRVTPCFFTDKLGIIANSVRYNLDDIKRFNVLREYKPKD